LLTLSSQVDTSYTGLTRRLVEVEIPGSYYQTFGICDGGKKGDAEPQPNGRQGEGHSWVLVLSPLPQGLKRLQ
jgi:hypothetical protein